MKKNPIVVEVQKLMTVVDAIYPLIGETWLALKRLFRGKRDNTVVLKNSKQSVVMTQFKDGRMVCEEVKQLMRAA